MTALACRSCGYRRFSLYTRKATAGHPASKAFFGLMTVLPAIPPTPEMLVATCLRCACEHVRPEIDGKTIHGALDPLP